MKVTLHLQNIAYEGCAQNVRMALEMIEGVRAVHIQREASVAHILYEVSATPYKMREQLLMGGYLAESPEGETAGLS